MTFNYDSYETHLPLLSLFSKILNIKVSMIVITTPNTRIISVKVDMGNSTTEIDWYMTRINKPTRRAEQQLNMHYLTSLIYLCELSKVIIRITRYSHTSLVYIVQSVEWFTNSTTGVRFQEATSISRFAIDVYMGSAAFHANLLSYCDCY
jgi:hypothetical protein